MTAFGAHSLGGYAESAHASLLTLGILLAVYDGAEIVKGSATPSGHYSAAC